MQTILPIFMALLIVVAMIFFLRAAAWMTRKESEAVVDDAELRALEIEKERALEALRDLEFDLQLKKISDDDYTAMRGPAESRAVRAIRQVEEYAGRLLVVVGCCLGLAYAAPAAAMPGSGGSAATGMPKDIRVVVSELTEEGLVQPAAHIPVLIEAHRRVMGPTNKTESVGEIVLLSDSRGVARGSMNVPAGSSFTAVAEKDGVVYHGYAGERTLFLDLYRRTGTTKDAEVEARFVVSVREGLLWVQAEWLLRQDGLGSLVSPEEGIPLPTLAPCIDGQPLSATWMPSQARKHIRTQAPTGTRVVLEGGHFRVHGVMAPGRMTRVTAEFPVDIVDRDMTLGIVSTSLPISRAMVALSYPAHLHPGVRLLESASRSLVDEKNGTKTQLVWTLGSRPVGKPLLVQFRRLPHEGDLGRDVAAWMIALAASLFAAGFLRVSARWWANRQHRPGLPS